MKSYYFKSSLVRESAEPFHFLFLLWATGAASTQKGPHRDEPCQQRGSRAASGGAWPGEGPASPFPQEGSWEGLGEAASGEPGQWLTDSLKLVLAN